MSPELMSFYDVWKDLNSYLVVDIDTHVDNSSPAGLPLVTVFTVKNNAPKGDDHPDVFFDEVILKIGIPPDMQTVKHRGLVAGESFTFNHRSRYADLGKIAFSVEGTVSPARLFSFRRSVSYTSVRDSSLPMASYIELMKDIDIRRWIKDVLEKVQVADATSSQSEIKAQQEKLKSAEDEINNMRKQLESINAFIERKTDAEKAKFDKHKRLIEEYLVHIDQACDKLSQVLDTSSPTTIDSIRNELVENLYDEANEIDQDNQNLLT